MNKTYYKGLGLCLLFTPFTQATSTEACDEIVYYAKIPSTQQEVLLCQNTTLLQLKIGEQPLITTPVNTATWWRLTDEFDTFSTGVTFRQQDYRYTFYLFQSEEWRKAGLTITQNYRPVKWITLDAQSVLHVIDNHLTKLGLKEYRPFPLHP